MKCVSGCKGFTNADCDRAPRCSYVNKTRKYCRLSHKYKMGPKPKCTVRNRTYNVKEEAAKKLAVNFKKTRTKKLKSITIYIHLHGEDLSEKLPTNIKNTVIGESPGLCTFSVVDYTYNTLNRITGLKKIYNDKK